MHSRKRAGWSTDKSFTFNSDNWFGTNDFYSLQELCGTESTAGAVAIGTENYAHLFIHDTWNND